MYTIICQCILSIIIINVSLFPPITYPIILPWSRSSKLFPPPLHAHPLFFLTLWFALMLMELSLPCSFFSFIDEFLSRTIISNNHFPVRHFSILATITAFVENFLCKAGPPDVCIYCLCIITILSLVFHMIL